LPKTKNLKDSGWKVIRIRQKPLRKIFPEDVVVPKIFNLKEFSNIILKKIERVLGIKINGLGEYVENPWTVNHRLAHKYIVELVNKQMKKRFEKNFE